MAHIVLLGDSIFDNAVYVPKGLSVIEQLRSALPDTWSATLLAVDGGVIADVHRQIQKLPLDTSHLVVSCGGNDALCYFPVLAEEVSNVAAALDRFAVIRAEFRSRYREMLTALQDTSHEVVVCTVYDSVPGLQPREQAALAMLNETILREAVGAGVTVIDLRHVCEEVSDYSELSPIEPSEQGGNKIAGMIAKVLVSDEADAAVVRIYR